MSASATSPSSTPIKLLSIADRLPYDPLTEISKFLDNKTVGALANTCRYFGNKRTKVVKQIKVINGTELVTEHKRFASPIAKRYYEYYTSLLHQIDLEFFPTLTREECTIQSQDDVRYWEGRLISALQNRENMRHQIERFLRPRREGLFGERREVTPPATQYGLPLPLLEIVKEWKKIQKWGATPLPSLEEKAPVSALLKRTERGSRQGVDTADYLLCLLAWKVEFVISRENIGVFYDLIFMKSVTPPSRNRYSILFPKMVERLASLEEQKEFFQQARMLLSAIRVGLWRFGWRPSNLVRSGLSPEWKDEEEGGLLHLVIRYGFFHKKRRHNNYEYTQTFYESEQGFTEENFQEKKRVALLKKVSGVSVPAIPLTDEELLEELKELIRLGAPLDITDKMDCNQNGEGEQKTPLQRARTFLEKVVRAPQEEFLEGVSREEKIAMWNKVIQVLEEAERPAADQLAE